MRKGNRWPVRGQRQEPHRVPSWQLQPSGLIERALTTEELAHMDEVFDRLDVRPILTVRARPPEARDGGDS